MSKSGYFQLVLNQRGSDLSNDDQGLDGDPVIEQEKTEQALQPPPMYRVIMLNDDFTPMDFVVEVLTDFFQLSLEKATLVMMQVHNEGKAICGTFPKDIAETKAALVNRYARENQHPLMCEVQRADV